MLSCLPSPSTIKFNKNRLIQKGRISVEIRPFFRGQTDGREIFYATSTLNCKPFWQRWGPPKKKGGLGGFTVRQNGSPHSTTDARRKYCSLSVRSAHALALRSFTNTKMPQWLHRAPAARDRSHAYINGQVMLHVERIMRWRHSGGTMASNGLVIVR